MLSSLWTAIDRLEIALTCPLCAARSREAMPTDACQFFFECPECHALLRPKAGDRCVFCRYGDVKCPPVQAACASCGQTSQRRFA